MKFTLVLATIATVSAYQNFKSFRQSFRRQHADQGAMYLDNNAENAVPTNLKWVLFSEADGVLAQGNDDDTVTAMLHAAQLHQAVPSHHPLSMLEDASTDNEHDTEAMLLALRDALNDIIGE
ncbi:hypothetical protein DYB38_005302 [Aphanomyces astaci]|uniref:Uncharacterized protein n=1 Tax=Aphanomyces astaci TaxID=112090 RepID=A0A397D260_APHAT|nr:hypothetical protein DYB38_005302 [Aphanomyces astaci]